MAPLSILRCVCVATIATTGCTFDDAVDTSARVTCRVDGECPDGQRCIEGPFVCDAPNGACIDDSDAAARALVDGASCGPDEDATVCVAGRCAKSRCGDGLVDPRSEECDDGDDNSGTATNACRADCVAPACGDGVVDDFESCDGVADNADLCSLCVATCAALRGNCDGDSEDLCECSPTVVSNEPIPFSSLVSFAVDSDGVYWFGTDGDLRRTPLSGGASVQIAPPTGRNEVSVAMAVDPVAVWRIGVDLVAAIPHLYRVEKATGVEQDAGPASDFVLDGTVVWIVLGSLIRADSGGSEVWATAEPYGFAKVAVGDTFVAAVDDAGRIWVFAKDGAPNPRVIEERQFATTILRAAGDTLAWVDGADVHRWRPDMAAPELLPRLSDGQQGLIVRDAVVGDDTVWVVVENRSEQRPGGVMRLRVGERAWVMHMRAAAFQARLLEDFVYFNDTTGFLRVPAY